MTDIYGNDSPEWKIVRTKLDGALVEDMLKCDEQDLMVSWYHGKLSRSAAEDILSEAINGKSTVEANGMFLVRDITSSDKDFSLFFVHNAMFYNFYIHCPKEGYYYIDGGPSIHGLEKLIEHYTEDAGNLPTCLATLCKGRVPPAITRRNGPTNILHRAIMENQQDIAVKILNHPKCPDIDAKNIQGCTALHEAASMGLDKIVSHLLHKGANIKIKDSDGNTPLHRACAANNGAICVQIISHDSSCLLERNPTSGWVPLHEAAMYGHLECVEILINSKAPIFPRALDDETPVELAEKYRRNRCIKVLEVTKSTSTSDTDEDFYHPELDRQGAEALIKGELLSDGLFLIRKSKKVENQNVLSLCYNKAIFNYEIKSKTYRGRLVYYIDSSPYHPSLLQLVQYYHYFEEGTPVKLQAYISRDKKKVPIKDMDVYCNLSSGSNPMKLPPRSQKKKPVPVPVPAPAQAKPERTSQPPEMSASPYASPPALSPLSSDPLNVENGSVALVEIPLKNIQKGSKLGEGEFGSVLKGVLSDKKKTGFLRKEKRTDVAIKIFHSVGSIDDFRREAYVMQSLHNEFIVELLGVCQGPPLMLIEEFMPMGSMLDYLEDYPKKVRVKEELYLWAAQIAMGMTYLETQSLVHRDLAARNILLKTAHHVKISDFGLSRATCSDKDYYKASKGGRWPIKWYAPESVNFGHFSHATDVWSYGVTLWEMFTYGKAPFENMSGVEVIKYIEDGKRLAKPEHCTPAVYQIMTRCWSLKPEDRPTFTDLSHTFDDDPEYVSVKEIIAGIKRTK